MNFDFKTIGEFNDYFYDDAVCAGFLEKQRWNGVPVCPHCGSEKHYAAKPRTKNTRIPTYRCAHRPCGLHFTVTTNTIFQGTQIGLRKWFQAMYEISVQKKGISSVQLAARVGISQKAAWFVNHRLREMLRDARPEMLGGTVEVDETYVGGKNKNRHGDKKIEGSQGRSAADKTPVVGLLQREGKVVTYVTRDTDAGTLQWLIRKNVATDAVVVTDAYRSYNGLEATHEHVKVKHEDGGYVVKREGKKFHTQNIENFWSQLKRGYIGVFHFISPQHLHRYCDEFSSRYNSRHLSNIDRFVFSLSGAEGKRLTYRELTETGLIR